MSGAAAPPDAGAWRIADAVLWRRWDGEIAAYNDLTGDTHHLVDLMAWIFARLAGGAATELALAMAAADAVELPSGADLPRAVGDVVALLRRLRLIEPEPGP